MNNVSERRKCGYCGTDYSPMVSHGTVLQDMWYRNEQYGWLCRNCEKQVKKYGTPVRIKERKESAKSKLMREANRSLYGTGWICRDIKVGFRKGEQPENAVVDSHLLECKYCGRTVRWRKSIDEFVKSKNIICDCQIIETIFCEESSLLNKYSTSQAKVLLEIYRNPKMNYTEIGKMIGISRQRVEQIRSAARSAYQKYMMKG